MRSTVTVVIEPGLINWHVATIQASNLGLIDVIANDMVAHFGHAGACHQADITGAENAYLHMIRMSASEIDAKVYMRSE